MTYSDKLKNPKWQKKRLEILERDGWKCRVCGDTEETLHVHHYYYEKGKDPWDYPDNALITLCCICHELNPPTKQGDEKDILEAIELLNLSIREYTNLIHGFYSIGYEENPGNYLPDFVEALRKAILLLREGVEENANPTDKA